MKPWTGMSMMGDKRARHVVAREETAAADGQKSGRYFIPVFSGFELGKGNLAWIPEIDSMRVPEHVTNAVAFLGYRKTPGNPSSETYRGTGFVVGVELGGITFLYLATADHVARQLEQVADPVAKLNDLNGRSYGYRLDRPLTIPFGDKTVETKAWYRHPADDEADVAVGVFTPLRATLRKNLAGVAFAPTWMFVSDKDLHPRRGSIGIGDEVFIMGLFHDVQGEESNTPIIRVGNIAMLPKQKVYSGAQVLDKKYGYMDAYLIEARSIGGISGSPIFVRGTVDVPKMEPNFQQPWSAPAPDMKASAADFALLGLAQGHWDLRPEDINASEPHFVGKGVNMGIAIVTPAKKLLETLHHPELVMQREYFVKSIQEQKRDQTATADSLFDDRAHFERVVSDAVPPRPSETTGNNDQ